MTLHPSWEARPASLRLTLVASTSTKEVREPAVVILDAIQGFPAARQIEAAFAIAVVLATTVGLDPHDLVSRAKAQVADIQRFETAFLALADYAKGELK